VKYDGNWEMILGLVTCLAAASPAKGVLVLDGFVLGCLTQDGWRSYRSVGALPPTTVSAVGIGGGENDVRNTAFNNSDDGLLGLAPGAGPSGVFFSKAPLYPREVIENKNDRSYYFPVVARFALAHGATSPRSYIVHVWSADLDNSGNHEEIIEAVSRPEVLRGNSEDGDWEAVLLRSKDKSGEKVFALHYSFSKAGQPLRQCRLRAVADFDGDGLMEMVSSAENARGKSATLWSFRAGKLMLLADVDYSRTPSAIQGLE